MGLTVSPRVICQIPHVRYVELLRPARKKIPEFASGRRPPSRPDDIYFTPKVTVPVPLDIKPGGDSNPINLKSKGVLPVAIVSTEEFDALTVDVDSILFGDLSLITDGGTAAAPLRYAEEDVTGDGLMDLTLKFSVPELVGNAALGAMSEEGFLSATTIGGDVIAGVDAIRIVGAKAVTIPEPSTLVLVVLGFVGLLASTKRRSTHTA